MFSLDYCLYWVRARFFSAGLMAITSLFVLAAAIGFIVVGTLKIVEPHIKTANQSHADKDYANSEVIEALDKRIKENPDNMQARLKFANKLIDANKLNRAYAILNAFENRIDQTQDIVSLGRIYMRLGRNEEAIRILSKIQTESRSFYESSFLIGEAKLRLQDYRGTLKAAQKIDGSHEAKFLRARAFYAQGYDEKTKRLVKQLSAAKAFTARLWRFRARIALDDNKFDDAFDASKKLIDAGGSLWDSQLIEVEIAIREGRFEDAEIWLNRLESKPVNYPPIRQARALLLAAQGEYRDAASVFDELENWSGSIMPRAHLLRAVLKLELGDQIQAKRILSDHIKNAPNDWRGLFLLSQLMLEEGEISRFKELVKKISTLAPQIDVGLYRQYQLAMYEGRYHNVREILMGLPPKNGSPANQLIGNRHDNMNSVHTIVRQSLFGPNAKMVMGRAPASKHFQYLRALTTLWNNNAPQKALAFYEVKTSPCANAELQQFQTHCQTFQRLLHVELLLANLKTDDARLRLDGAIKEGQNSFYGISLSNHLDIREGNPDLVTARLEQYYRPVDQQDASGFDSQNSQYFGEQLVFHQLQNGTLEQAITLTRADAKLLESAEVFRALANAVIAEVHDKGSVHLTSPIFSKLANSDDIENNKNGARPAIHFVEFLANYGVTFHRDLEAMLLSARLYELMEALPQAGGTYRELLLAYTDDWRAIDAFTKFMDHKDRRASGRSFVKAVLSRLADDDINGRVQGRGASLMQTDEMLMVAMDLLDDSETSEVIAAYQSKAASGRMPIIIALSGVYQKQGADKKSVDVLNKWLVNYRANHDELQGRDALIIAQAFHLAGDASQAADVLEIAIKKGMLYVDQSGSTHSNGRISERMREQARMINQDLIIARARLILDKTPFTAGDPQKSLDDLRDVEFARWAYLQQNTFFKSGAASFYYQQALIKAGYHEMATILGNEAPRLARLAGKV